jgi:hypothetical protein
LCCSYGHETARFLRRPPTLVPGDVAAALGGDSLVPPSATSLPKPTTLNELDWTAASRIASSSRTTATPKPTQMSSILQEMRAAWLRGSALGGVLSDFSSAAAWDEDSPRAGPSQLHPHASDPPCDSPAAAGAGGGGGGGGGAPRRVQGGSSPVSASASASASSPSLPSSAVVVVALGIAPTATQQAQRSVSECEHGMVQPFVEDNAVDYYPMQLCLRLTRWEAASLLQSLSPRHQVSLDEATGTSRCWISPVMTVVSCRWKPARLHDCH